MRWYIKICIFKFCWLAHFWFTVKFWEQKSSPFWNGDGFFRRWSGIPIQVFLEALVNPKTVFKQVFWIKNHENSSKRQNQSMDQIFWLLLVQRRRRSKKFFYTFFSKKSNFSKTTHPTKKVLYIKLKVRPRQIQWCSFQRATSIRANVRRKKRFFFLCTLSLCARAQSVHSVFFLIVLESARSQL